MTSAASLKYSCRKPAISVGWLLAPSGEGLSAVRRVIKTAAEDAEVHLISPDDAGDLPFSSSEAVLSEIIKADLVLALVSQANANVFYEVGLAHATGKPVIFLVEGEEHRFE